MNFLWFYSRPSSQNTHIYLFVQYTHPKMKWIFFVFGTPKDHICTLAYTHTHCTTFIRLYTVHCTLLYCTILTINIIQSIWCLRWLCAIFFSLSDTYYFFFSPVDFIFVVAIVVVVSFFRSAREFQLKCAIVLCHVIFDWLLWGICARALPFLTIPKISRSLLCWNKPWRKNNTYKIRKIEKQDLKFWNNNNQKKK